ncbi:hypothetical protein PC129_g16295 [Phytophthora cactorum]|uniref:Uncharacterized protein n=1 Tax=Phytophthora cactorum TaxID=29920 RepID=A0A8T1HL39_9STRA|nr:hypothetical protein PC129_g16295 [Phytophthora cactorum]
MYVVVMWDVDELVAAANHIQLHSPLTRKTIEERFEVYGGVARECLAIHEKIVAARVWGLEMDITGMNSREVLERLTNDKRENRFFCILPGLQDASLGCAIRPCCIVAFRVVNHSYHTTESDLACDRLRGALVATCATALVSAALLSPDALLDLGAGYAIRSFSSAT